LTGEIYKWELVGQYKGRPNLIVFPSIGGTLRRTKMIGIKRPVFQTKKKRSDNLNILTPTPYSVKLPLYKQ